MSDSSSSEAGRRRKRKRRSKPTPESAERVRVRVRRRASRSPLEQMLLKPFLEILASLGGLAGGLRRRPLVPLALGAAGFWLAWPAIKPSLPQLLGLGSFEATTAPPQVITVFVEDPQRTIHAMDLWRRKPGSLLVLQGRPSSQRDNRGYLERQGKWPRDEQGLVRLEPGCDTVGQVAALAQMLAGMNRSGHLTMVTSPAHLQRTLAVGRTVLGPLGWTVAGESAYTGDNRPEHPLRYWRDQLRAHVLRLTGISGSAPDSQCP
jgi:hypothetical protein